MQFGVSVFAVVLTVAAFMCGLGAGSLFASRIVSKIINPLRILALLEAGIAIYALLLPLLLKIASTGIENSAAQLSLFQWYGLIAFAAMCLLLIPAFAMGAGFPMILAALGNKSESLGRIYGINTLGAACGALLPLWLLPALGWSGAIRITAFIGIAVAFAFLILSKTNRPGSDVERNSANQPPMTSLIAYAGIGAASLVLEIGWTRLFGMVMLRTEYVLALILAAFLLGIGLGSYLAPRQHRQIWFVILPITASGFSLISLWMLPVFSAWIEQAEFASLFGAMANQGLILILVTLPVTMSLGAWLPMLNSRMGGGGVWLYGANSLGAALGAISAGLVLIPHFGSAATVAIAALALLMLGFTWIKIRAVWLIVPIFLVAAWPVYKFPPASKLLPHAQAGSQDLFHYEDAVSMTQVVEQLNGQRLLLTDMQRMDASTDPTAVFVQSNQARLPLLLHENPKSVLFLGLGTGISMAGSLPFPELQRNAVELSQGAIDSATSWFVPINHDVLQLAKVERDDARHFLSSTPDHYDVIIGDVFHPDLAGLSSLLSVQQFQRARNKLTENGLFVQWLAINQFDKESLTIIMRSFKQAFPDAQLFLDGMHLAMVGPQQNFMGANGFKSNLRRLSAEQKEMATAGEGDWTWLGRYLGPIDDSSGPIQDEWSPVIEYRLPRARYSGSLDVTSTLQYLLQRRISMNDAAAMLAISENERESFERAFAGTELMMRSWIATSQGLSTQANRLMFLAYQANAKDRWIAYALADTMLASIEQAGSNGLSKRQALEKILQICPQHVEALRALWHLQRDEKDIQSEYSRARLLELSPLDREAKMAGS